MISGKTGLLEKRILNAETFCQYGFLSFWKIQIYLIIILLIEASGFSIYKWYEKSHALFWVHGFLLSYFILFNNV